MYQNNKICFCWLDEYLYKILKVCLETISINIDGDTSNQTERTYSHIFIPNLSIVDYG